MNLVHTHPCSLTILHFERFSPVCVALVVETANTVMVMSICPLWPVKRNWAGDADVPTR